MICSLIFCGCFCLGKVELDVCDRDWPVKLNIFWLALYLQKKFAHLFLRFRKAFMQKSETC